MDYSKIKLPCTVVKVIDGDTVICTIDHLLNIYTKDARIRLAGIDAPSLKASNGVQAKKELETLIAGKELSISFIKVKNRLGDKETKKDKFGRYLGYLWVGDISVNQHMIDMGLAVKMN